jgi:integrase
MHSCCHGFATSLLQRGVVTVAKLGGWKSVRHVFETYGHSNDDTTLTISDFWHGFNTADNAECKETIYI